MCYYSNKTHKQLTNIEAARISARNEAMFIEYMRTGKTELLNEIEHIIRVKN
jgi:hypothetical protein